MPDIHAVKVIEDGQEVLYNISDDVARNGHFIGDVYANANNDYSGGNKLPDETRVNELIASAIGGISGLDIIIVNELPQVGSANTIYFVLTKQGNTGDYYDEYMYINSTWELIGTTQIDLSSKADKADTVLDTTLSRGRKANTTVGEASFAFGANVEASGSYAHAEGEGSTASMGWSHAEGSHTTASGEKSHAEGSATTASGTASHSEGNVTLAYELYSHSEGDHTEARGQASHAEGATTEATGNHSHAEGYNTNAYGERSHAEGINTNANGDNSHAEGYQTTASGAQSHAEGGSTTASASNSHAEGGSTTASASNSHAEGGGTTASGAQSHAEGGGTTASGAQSHAEGGGATASGVNAHAEGGGTIASGADSHAEGTATIAVGSNSHAGGSYNVSDSYNDWPLWTAGTNYAVGDKVKRNVWSSDGYYIDGFICKTANSDSVFDGTKWIVQNGRMNYAEIIGNGTDINARSNARALDWDGNEYLAGDVYVNCGSDSTGGSKLPNESRVNQLIASAIGGISSLNIVILQALPQVGSSDTIYFILKTGSTNDLYDEYMYINNSWELIGTREIDISGKADKADTVLDTTLSRGRAANTAVGDGSFAFGDGVEASGILSHAEGGSTIASSAYSHAEGSGTTASGSTSHAEGRQTTASGAYSHVEGYSSSATNLCAHAEGQNSTASGSRSHAEGEHTTASGESSHAEGSHTEASGDFSHVEGSYNEASGDNSHSEGGSTTASGDNSHAEGDGTVANGIASHAEGWGTTASGAQAHAEGGGTSATGDNSHAEGGQTVASGSYSHAGGYSTVASGSYSYVGGIFNIPDTYGDWPEWVAGTSYEAGDKVKRTTSDSSGTFVIGYICKTANSDSTFNETKWINLYEKMNHAVIVGNGENEASRSNAYALDWDGTGHFAGDVYVNCGSDSTGGTKLLKASDIPPIATIAQTQAIITEYAG